MITTPLRGSIITVLTLQTERLGDLPKLIQLVGSTAVIGIYIRLTPKPIIFSDYLLKYRLINHLFL